MSVTEIASDRPLRGALLGTGPISVYHMLAWREIPDVRIVALGNRTRSRAEAMGRDFCIDDAHIYADYRALLDAEALDFVDIATAPKVHREQVLAAAARGIHILCQKPLATSMDEAREMQQACSATGARCFVHHNWRWRRWYQETKRLLDQGTIGKPRYARFQVHSDAVLPRLDGMVPPLLAREPTLATLPMLIAFDTGVHLIDTMRFLFGRIRRVYASMSHFSELVQGEDLALIVLEFDDAVTGVIDMSWATYVSGDKKPLIRGNVDPFVVEGDRGTIELDPYRDDSLIVVTATGAQQYSARAGMTPAEAYQESFTQTQRHVVRCLRTGEAGQNEIAANLETLAALFAAYESASRHEVISLSPSPGG